MNNRLGASRDFKCGHCHYFVSANPILSGVRNRNHCPYCLWSRHMDLHAPGDRLSACKALMEPVSLSAKRIRNKYGKRLEPRETRRTLQTPLPKTLQAPSPAPASGATGLYKENKGELMLVHLCVECGKASINRIAADDDVEAIAALFARSLDFDPQTIARLERDGIRVLGAADLNVMRAQLFGHDASSKALRGLS